MSGRLYDDEPGDEMDVADEVAYADTGRPWGARVIGHPSHARTRAHFAALLAEVEQDRRWSA